MSSYSDHCLHVVTARSFSSLESHRALISPFCAPLSTPGDLRELSFKQNLSPGRPSPSASGLITQRSDGSGTSVIKAVTSTAAPSASAMADDRGEEVLQPQRSAASGAVLGATPERLLVIPAGGLGKAASRTPRTKSGLARTPSGAVSIDITTRTPSRSVTRTPTREIDRLHVESRAPPRFTCPIGGRIMRDPVILATGTTCDRGALERYLAKGNKRCPVTKRPLRKPIHLMPNIELRHNIAAWARRNAPWILDADGQLAPNEPDRSELQGDDVQYVTPIVDAEAPGAAGPGGGGNRSPSRIESGKGGWRFTDGSKVRPGAQSYNINASAGSGTRGAPWASHRGISSPPRSARRHRSVSRSISPSKRDPERKRDWYSTGFLASVALANLILFIMSLWQGQWKLQPLAANPWYGPGQDALAAVGAQTLTLMENNGSYWRLFSAPFLPAGVIHLAACLLGLWAFGRYAQLALPRPQISVAAVYLLSAIVGALVEANLDAVYLTCGAFAGVCGLLGAVAADQAVNFGQKKLWNMQEWYIVSIILLIPTAAIVTTALFPMVGLWSAVTALVCGFLGTAALLLAPRVGRGKPGNPKWATLQILASLTVVGVFFAAIAGVALPNKLGESVTVLQDASCVNFGSLQCVPFGFTASGCGVQQPNSANATLVCPAPAAPVPLPAGTTVTLGDATATDALCAQYCSGSSSDESSTETPAAPETEEAGTPPAPPTATVPVTVIDLNSGAGASGTPPAPVDPAPGTIVITDPSTVTTIPATTPTPTPPAPTTTINIGGTPTTVIPATTMSAAAGRKLRAGGARR